MGNIAVGETMTLSSARVTNELICFRTKGVSNEMAFI